MNEKEAVILALHDRRQSKAAKVANGETLTTRKRKRPAPVLEWTGITKLDLPPDRVLNNAKGRLDGVLILGWDKDGDLYTASSYADGGEVLWLLELTKRRLFEVIEE